MFRSFFLATSPATQRGLLHDYVIAYLNDERLIQAVRASVPLSVLPALDALLRELRAADWKTV